ncbi:creatininase family protein [Mucilaginibacter sp. dw_454]|uniref:creatininase family protein n=1 Tax=Mucilaginibacter sp. dw_454 TaxID=2720079 RepID=UPI001BD62632|nr:creatininase family protein [Mucilaginibacter sp. dw_454]
MTKFNFLTIILFAFTSTTYAQTDGDWYGSVSRNGRTGSVLALHLKGKNATVDFLSEQKNDQKPSEVDINDKSIYLVLPEREIAIEGTLNDKAELVGNVIYSGKPYAIIFTKNKIEAATLEKKRGGPDVEFSDKSMSPDPDTKRVIPKSASLFIEELTWLDVRDNLREGKNTIIIGTGGVEQSGPYIPTGKHTYITRVLAKRIAEKLGNALVAPIVPFVPEGGFYPPTGHVKYPGTISVREDTYENLLSDIATSYKVEGFKTIVFFGDSGGNQWGMYRVTKALNDKWKGDGTHVIFVPEYYDNNRLSAWLKTQGIEEGNEGIHDNYKVESQIMVLDPALVRAQQRIETGHFSINGVQLAPVEKTVEMGKKIVDYQADIVVKHVQKALSEQ